MIRNVLLFLSAVVVFIAVVVFALSNPGSITLDLAFAEIETRISIAFAVTMVAGWLWGMLSMLSFVFALMRDRRALRKQVRVATTELNTLRALPVHDAR
ncbi:MAG: lipopolysaccharide assembly protein LapA domain-containing protein [Pseudomonadota bacterium]